MTNGAYAATLICCKEYQAEAPEKTKVAKQFREAGDANVAVPSPSLDGGPVAS